jgi:hypothetical protein
MHFKKFLFFSFSICLFFVSCSNKKDLNNPIQTNLITIQNVDWLTYNWFPRGNINPSNQQNPYDSIGLKHNTALDFYISRESTNMYYQTWNEFKDSVCIRIADFAFIKGYCQDKNILYNQIRNPFYNPPLTYEELAVQNSESLISANFKNSILNYMLVDSIGMLKSIQSWVDTLKTIETNIINNSFSVSFNSNEKEDVLVYCSVLRYSLVYWHEVDSSIRTDYELSGFSHDSSGTIQHDIPCKTRAQYDADWAKTHPTDPALTASAYSAVAKGIANAAHKVGDVLVAIGKWFQSW